MLKTLVTATLTDKYFFYNLLKLEEASRVSSKNPDGTLPSIKLRTALQCHHLLQFVYVCIQIDPYLLY